jgi:hypothetical protein
MNHRITVWKDGPGFWFRITDTRTGIVVRETWGPGTARAARLHAVQVVGSIEWMSRQEAN